MRLQSLVPLILVASPIAVSAFGCYGATQVTVVLTTDLACDGAVDTLLYKGVPQSLDSTPSAETKACTTATQAGADNTVGTVTLTPSGDKNAQVQIRAVLARNGKDPSTCDADATDCIFQTRTFSFAEHSSQRVAIRLLEECIGTVCAAGQTCVGPGLCSSSQVTCTDPAGCADGGADGGSTGGPPPVVPVCAQRGANRDGVLATSDAIPGAQMSAFVRATASSVAAIAWYGPDQLAHRVAVDGLSAVRSASAGQPIAVTDGRDGLLAAIVSAGSNATILLRGTAQTRVPNVAGAESIAATSDVAIIGAQKGVFQVSGTNKQATLLGSYEGLRVAATSGAAYAAASDGVHKFTIGAGGMEQAPVTPLNAMGSSPVVFAVSPVGAMAYAAGSVLNAASPTARMVVIANLQDPVPLASPYQPKGTDPITSLATDDTFLYFTHADDGVRVVNPKKSAPESQLYPAAGAAVPTTIAHLAVDDTCVYLWESAKSGAVLRAVPKP